VLSKPHKRKLSESKSTGFVKQEKSRMKLSKASRSDSGKKFIKKSEDVMLQTPKTEHPRNLEAREEASFSAQCEQTMVK